MERMRAAAHAQDRYGAREGSCWAFLGPPGRWCVGWGDCPLVIGGLAGWGWLAAPCCHNKPFLPTGCDLGAIVKWMVPGG